MKRTILMIGLALALTSGCGSAPVAHTASRPPAKIVYEAPPSTSTTTSTTTTTTVPETVPETEPPVVEEAPVIEPAAQPEPEAPASDGSRWDAIAQCESGGDWAINDGSGYYGGLQFSLSTWASVGGTGLPSDASKGEQIAKAEILLARDGWGSWPVCSQR